VVGEKNQVFVYEIYCNKEKKYDFEFVRAINGIVFAREHKDTESIKIWK
jgi:hypothetical protein